MPAAPKPAERRERRNAPLQLVPAGDRLPPPVPKGFLKVTRDEWAAYWLSPVGELVDEGTDLPAIKRLFTLRDERERAYRAYRKQRIVEGSKGQPVLNPIAKQMGSMDSEIRQLEDRLGLTPKSRAHLGITFGQAKRTLADLNRDLDVD